MTAADGANSKSRRVARQVRHLRRWRRPSPPPGPKARHSQNSSPYSPPRRRRARAAQRARCDAAARRRRERVDEQAGCSRTWASAPTGRAAASAATAAAMAAVDDATRRASADTSAIGVGGLLGADPTRLDADVDPRRACAERCVSTRTTRTRLNFAPSEAARARGSRDGRVDSASAVALRAVRREARRGGRGMARRGANPTRVALGAPQYGRLEEAGRLALGGCARTDAERRRRADQIGGAWLRAAAAHTRASDDGGGGAGKTENGVGRRWRNTGDPRRGGRRCSRPAF